MILIGLFVAFERWSWQVSHAGSDPFHGLARKVLFVGGIAVGVIALAGLLRALNLRRGAYRPLTVELVETSDPLAAVREQSLARGGGALLGFSGEQWVAADYEHATLVLGPYQPPPNCSRPRSST